MIPRRVQLCAVILLCLVAAGTSHAEPCRGESFKGASYIVCSFDPSKDDLRLYWRGGDGEPYRTFAALAADLEGKGKSLRFAMNGGMYQGNFRPVGLYIENGRELAPANTAAITGTPSGIPNFYKKPNGVFYIGDKKAGVLETERFLADGPKANFATQSGPMLVIDGVGWIAASGHGSSADVAVRGIFLATKDCPAFQSFRKGTNPGGVKILSGHSYSLLAKNTPNATHYRVRIDGATPPERWVSVNCGSATGDENSGLQDSESTGGASIGRQAKLVLSLGWEPGFCESHDDKPECASETSDRFDANHFTLHGLWPQPRRREYCNVSQDLINTDKKGGWQALPNVDLSTETRARLGMVMPGTQSLLERHEWIRHGTCYGGGDAETYFREALALVDAVNSSAVQALFAANVGQEITVAAVRGAFDAAFGVGAGDRVRLACKRDGPRLLITEITIGLGARPDGSTPLADLIKASSMTRCPGGIVDAVGRQ